MPGLHRPQGQVRPRNRARPSRPLRAAKRDSGAPSPHLPHQAGGQAQGAPHRELPDQGHLLGAAVLGEHLDRLQGVGGAGHGAGPGRRTVVAAGELAAQPVGGGGGGWSVRARAVAMADGGEWRLGRCGAGKAVRLDFFSGI